MGSDHLTHLLARFGLVQRLTAWVIVALLHGFDVGHYRRAAHPDLLKAGQGGVPRTLPGSDRPTAPENCPSYEVGHRLKSESLVGSANGLRCDAFPLLEPLPAPRNPLFDRAANVRENIAGDVLASGTTMQWNSPAKGWNAGAVMADASLNRRQTIRVGASVAYALVGNVGFDGQIEFEALRLLGPPEAAPAVLNGTPLLTGALSGSGRQEFAAEVFRNVPSFLRIPYGGKRMHRIVDSREAVSQFEPINQENRLWHTQAGAPPSASARCSLPLAFLVEHTLKRSPTAPSGWSCRFPRVVLTTFMRAPSRGSRASGWGKPCWLKTDRALGPRSARSF